MPHVRALWPADRARRCDRASRATPRGRSPSGAYRLLPALTARHDRRARGRCAPVRYRRRRRRITPLARYGPRVVARRSPLAPAQGRCSRRSGHYGCNNRCTNGCTDGQHCASGCAPCGCTRCTGGCTGGCNDVPRSRLMPQRPIAALHSVAHRLGTGLAQQHQAAAATANLRTVEPVDNCAPPLPFGAGARG